MLAYANQIIYIFFNVRAPFTNFQSERFLLLTTNKPGKLMIEVVADILKSANIFIGLDNPNLFTYFSKSFENHLP